MEDILKVLRQERFIHDYRAIDDKKQGVLRVYLKKTGEPVRKITKIIRVSKPGLRIYTKRNITSFGKPKRSPSNLPLSP